MTSLTVTAEPNNVPPRYRLDYFVDGFFGTDTTVTILRNDSDGTVNAVRTANPAALVAGLWTGYDYESPFGSAPTYECFGDTLPGVVTVAASAPSLYEYGVQRPWLLHPGLPSLSMPVTVKSRGDRVRSSRQGVHDVLGRADPIVITDGTRRAATFDLVLRTESLEEEQALEDLLEDSSVLLLQIIYPELDRTECRWVSIGDVTQQDLVPWFGTDAANWTLPCTQTAAPSGLLQAQRTWGDVLAGFTTWADVIASYATWNDVVTDSRL